MILEEYIRESLIDFGDLNIDQFLKTNKGCTLLIHSIMKDIEKTCKDTRNCEKIIDFVIKSSDKNLEEINEDESKIIDKYPAREILKRIKKFRKFKEEIKLKEAIVLFSVLSILGAPIAIPILGKLGALLIIAVVTKWSHDYGKKQGEFDAVSVNNKFSNKIAKAINQFCMVLP